MQPSNATLSTRALLVESGNPRQWIGHITGAPGTPYEHRGYSIAIVFPEGYPMKPFQVTFTTPLSHPDVSADGAVRLAELDEKHWSPVFTVRSVLICLQALLSQGITKSTAANNPREHKNSSNPAEGFTEPTHYGRRIGGKKYGMSTSRAEFEEYKKLPVGERDGFFVEHADIVRDM